MGFVIAVTCYGEKVTLQQAISYGIIVLSILLFNWWNPRLRGQEAGTPQPGTPQPGERQPGAPRPDAAPKKMPA
jgi:hypothetical protein